MNNYKESYDKPKPSLYHRLLNLFEENKDLVFDRQDIDEQITESSDYFKMEETIEKLLDNGTIIEVDTNTYKYYGKKNYTTHAYNGINTMKTLPKTTEEGITNAYLKKIAEESKGQYEGVVPKDIEEANKCNVTEINAYTGEVTRRYQI